MAAQRLTSFAQAVRVGPDLRALIGDGGFTSFTSFTAVGVAIEWAATRVVVDAWELGETNAWPSD